MIQSETERQFYLSMAGVHLWYARDALPGAAPSPDYVYLESEDIQERFETTKECLNRPGNKGKGQPQSIPNAERINAFGKPDLKALMNGSEAVRTEVTTESEAGGPSGHTGNTEEVVADPAIVDVGEPDKLSVQVWLGERFAMIASLSSDVSVRLQEALALKILLSLGETDSRTLGAIHWPVFNNYRVPGNSLADLVSVLNHVMSELEDQRLLVLGVGDDIASRVLTAGELQNNRQITSFPHSLSEMAANPSLKRELWHQIKPMAV